MLKMMEVTKVIDGKEVVIRKRVKKLFPNKSKTNQGKAKQVHINTIMERYHKAKSMPSDPRQGLYGDFSNVGSFHDAMNKIKDAKEDFSRLSSKIRKRFENNPAKLIEFISNKENLEEAYELGLVVRPEKESGPVKVEIINKEEPASTEAG